MRQPSTQNNRLQTTSAIPGATVIGGIRRLLIIAVVAALAYPMFTRGSRGFCPGGVDGNGGFTDATGQAVADAPPCIHLTLGPSPLLYLGIALIVILAIGRVGKEVDQSAALQTLNRVAIGVCVLVLVAAVISHVWFRLVPIQDFTSESWSLFSPFPFGLIEVDIAPMSVN